MKILATEIKAGSVIKFGNLWGVATTEPTQSLYAANEVDVLVEVTETKIRRREGKETVPAHATVFSYRKTTQVLTK